MEYGLWYPEGQDFTLEVFTDADWEGIVGDRKSTSGATFFLGNCLVSWPSKKHSPFHSLQQKQNIFFPPHVALWLFGCQNMNIQ